MAFESVRLGANYARKTWFVTLSRSGRPHRAPATAQAGSASQVQLLLTGTFMLGTGGVTRWHQVIAPVERWMTPSNG